MALIKLPDDFYSNVREYVKEVKNRVGVDPNLDNMREYGNLIKTLNDIIKLRLNKIVLRSLYHQDDMDDFTKEEKELFVDVSRLINDYESQMDFTVNKSPGKHNSTKPDNDKLNRDIEKYDVKDKKIKDDKNYGSIEEGFLVVRIKQNIPAYSGVDGNIYGPFESGAEVKLPREEAEFLVNANMADSLNKQEKMRCV